VPSARLRLIGKLKRYKETSLLDKKESPFLRAFFFALRSLGFLQTNQSPKTEAIKSKP
jgi:hypothetical protein